ncbi:glutaredoxin family protein [Thiolinea disciformis]|uniref:glutaredoxin family protein n=1 Tax=Thiolinea disciformis TaxID=125614 RepID=UPI0003625007|nr:glutaredoxin family protein [Thiolinea disciformis]
MNKQTKPQLSVYYRAGCHLCEQLIAELSQLQQALQETIDFDFELIDIDQDAALRKRYDVDVPVVALNDEVLCYHFFDADTVRQALNHG